MSQSSRLSLDEARKLAFERCQSRRTQATLDRERQHLLALQKSSDEEGNRIFQRLIGDIDEELRELDGADAQAPQGLDEQFIETIEMLATLKGLCDVEAHEEAPTVLIQQWKLGALYNVVSVIGKLAQFSRNEKHSLTNLWNVVAPHILAEGFIEAEEHQAIEDLVSGSSAIMTYAARGSVTRLLRDKTISHNDYVVTVDIDEVYEEFLPLIRIWSIVSNWCSWRLCVEFRSSEVALAPLDKVYDAAGYRLIKESREAFLKRVVANSVTQLHNGEPTDRLNGIAGRDAIRTTAQMQPKAP